MATYEYECPVHSIFEHTQSINSPALERCPMCEKENIQSPPPKRLISLSSFALIGGGWAKDNYK